MNNTQFWGAPGSGFQPGASGYKSTKKKGNGSVAKKLGISTVVLVVVLAIVGILGYVYIGKPAYALYTAANILKSDTAKIGEALSGRDLVALDAELNKTEDHLKSLREQREQSFGWAKDFKALKINEYYSDSERFINAGFYAIDALREVEKVVLPFADAAGLKVSPDQELPEQEGLMEAFQSWVSIMPEVAGQMDGVIEKVSKIGEELEPINTDKYPESFRGTPVRENIVFIKDGLSKADDYAPDLKQALVLIPRVLAVDTLVKRYMIIMQNDKEIRPTGGFMTNYATFKIANGLLDSDFTSKDMYSVDLTLDLIDATYDFPDPPGPYGKYLLVERWYARDMNYSPDFVTSMDQFLKFYNMAGRINPIEVKPVDGIFAIDTQVISELLEVTGPVTVNGVTYTKDNVVLELERIASLALKDQAGRKRVLGYLMQAMLTNVFESDKNLWPKLIDKGISLAARKHVQAYVFDPEVQALLDKYDVGGRIKQETKGDYSFVVSTNLGGDKTNWFVTKVVNHKLEKSGDKWLRTVNIVYSYNQPDGEFAPFIKQFKDWVRVYAPIGSEFISVDGSEDGTMTDQESNRVWYSGFITLQPGETKEITFKYYIPSNFVQEKQYDLYIQKQAGINGEKHTVSYDGKNVEVTLENFKEVSIKN